MLGKNQDFWRQWLAKWAIRCKKIKQVSIELHEVEALINDQMPFQFEVETPGGLGNMSLIEVRLSIPEDSTYLQATCLCNLRIKVKQTLVYNSHIRLMFDAKPKYYCQEKTIGLTEVKVGRIELISDQYSLIKDPLTLFTNLLPKPVKSLLNFTVTSSQLLLEGVVNNRIMQYLSLYSGGSKQKVLDYHQAEIENKVKRLLEDPHHHYPLDLQVFEEALFAQYGKTIKIANGLIFFVFHDE